MFEFILVAVWIALVTATYLFTRPNPSRLDNPIIVLLTPQIFAVALIPVLAYLNIVIPAVSMAPLHALYLLTVTLLISAGIFIGAFGKQNIRVKVEKYVSDNSAPFWISFFVGTVGTLLLLRNMNIHSFVTFYNVVANDFNSLEDGFFNSSAAILWQANIASFFWYNTVRRPSKAMKFALGLSLLAVFSRGALLYLIIASFYYVISNIYLRGRGELPIRQFLLLILFTQVIFVLSYSFEGNLAEVYFQKTYPYLSGNFVNLYRHIDIASAPSSGIDGVDDISQSMGLSSIRFYLEKYLDIDFQPSDRMIFYPQAQNAPVYGNTHTLYGQVVYLPIVLLVIFVAFLGVAIGFIYKYAGKNLLFLSIHCWFSAATFLSFGGAGHFTTTRIFPAMLFIWPLIFLTRVKLRPSALLKRHTTNTKSN
jgi:hypothetical protein